MKTMTTMTHWAPAGLSADSRPAHPCPLTVGVEVPAGLVIPLPLHPPPPHGDAFILVTDQKEMPSGASGIPPGNKKDHGRGAY